MKRERERERDSGKRFIMGLLAILQTNPDFKTTAAQHDVEMADPALYLNLC